MGNDTSTLPEETAERIGRIVEGTSVMPYVIRVIDDSDRPVPGAFVEFAESRVAVPDIALVTGADGAIRLNDLPKTRFKIRAHTPDGRAGEATVLGGEAADDDVIDIVIRLVS